MSGTLHLHVCSRLLSVLVCLSLFLSLSLYIYICDHRLQQHVWGYACDLAFATNLRLVLKSSPNRFEHRERNLVLQASLWLSYILQMIPLWFSLVCYVFHCFQCSPTHCFPMYSFVFLCIPTYICGYCRCFVSVYLCELADVMWKGTSVESGYFSLRHWIQVLSAPRGRKTESAFQPLLWVLLGILMIIVGRRPASGRASMRAAKEGSMEGSRMVSKWFF